MEFESLRSGTLNFWKMQGARRVAFSILNLSSQMHFWSQLLPGGHYGLLGGGAGFKRRPGQGYGWEPQAGQSMEACV